MTAKRRGTRIPTDAIQSCWEEGDNEKEGNNTLFLSSIIDTTNSSTACASQQTNLNHYNRRNPLNNLLLSSTVDNNTNNRDHSYHHYLHPSLASKLDTSTSSTNDHELKGFGTVHVGDIHTECDPNYNLQFNKKTTTTTTSSTIISNTVKGSTSTSNSTSIGSKIADFANTTVNISTTGTCPGTNTTTSPFNTGGATNLRSRINHNHNNHRHQLKEAQDTTTASSTTSRILSQSDTTGGNRFTSFGNRLQKIKIRKMMDARSTASSTRSTSDAPTIPSLAISELDIGRVIGTGGFSVVREINNIKLDEVYDTGYEEARIRESFANTFLESIDRSKGNLYRGSLVLKSLRDDLPNDERSKGIVDLAVEARFLKKISHPHIIAMRAMANSDPLESRYFVVLDRLVHTLDRKMRIWREDVSVAQGFWLGPCIGYCCSRTAMLRELWRIRMIVARDIASAIQHLHNKNVIYRDLKPDNIGFDHAGTVKIFDFGLARALHDDERNSVGLYNLTGNTGSLRYMAPEVALNRPYDLRADTYSFGILFWQLCALSTPYAGYNTNMHATLVIGKGNRPKPEISWPLSWKALMKQCWSQDIFDRPDFDRIMSTLDDEVELLEEEVAACAGGISGGKSSVENVRAKKSKKKIGKDGQNLDLDTRKNAFEVDGAVNSASFRSQTISDIV